jgi:hypothetical protein
MDTKPNLESGIYANIFPVELGEENVRLMVIERSNYPDLRPLRAELQSRGNVWVYADKDKIYGFGENCACLTTKQFREESVNLYDVPRLTANNILDGVCNKMKARGCLVDRTFGRAAIFDFNKPHKSRDGNIAVFRGIDLRSIFLYDRGDDKLKFGLIVDVTYRLKDKTDQSISIGMVRQRYGSETLAQVRQIQGDMIPTGINTEASRQRLVDHIFQFLIAFADFTLPIGVQAKASTQPVRVILGGRTP